MGKYCYVASVQRRGMRLGAHGGGQGLGHIVSPCTQLVTDANDRQTSDSIIASCTNLGGGAGHKQDFCISLPKCHLHYMCQVGADLSQTYSHCAQKLTCRPKQYSPMLRL